MLFLLNRSIITVLITAIMVGQVVSLTPDYQKAKEAADRVFHLIGNVPRIDCYSDAGEQPVRISIISPLLTLAFWCSNGYYVANYLLAS